MSSPTPPKSSISIGGGVEGANVVIGGRQSVRGDLRISVGTMPAASEDQRYRLENQLTRLMEVLENIAEAHPAEVEQVKVAAEDAVGEVQQKEPDQNRLRIRLDALKRTAAAFTSIAPVVAEVVSQISSTIASIGSIG